MSNVTLSEIADLEFRLKAAMFQIEACDEQIERQANTIRAQAEALKIATEALEGIVALPDKVPVTDGVGVSQAMRYGLEVSAKQATQALTRIKEV